DDKGSRLQACQQAAGTEDEAVHDGAARQAQQDHVAGAGKVGGRLWNNRALQFETGGGLSVDVPHMQSVRGEQPARQGAAHGAEADVADGECHWSNPIMALTSRYSSRPNTPISRPLPDCL